MQIELGLSRQAWAIRIAAFLVLVFSLVAASAGSTLYFMRDGGLFWSYHNGHWMAVLAAISVLYAIAAILLRDSKFALAGGWLISALVALSPLMANAILPESRTLPEYVYTDLYFALRDIMVLNTIATLALLVIIIWFWRPAMSRGSASPAGPHAGSKREPDSREIVTVLEQPTPTELPLALLIDGFWRPTIDAAQCPLCLPGHKRASNGSTPDC